MPFTFGGGRQSLLHLLDEGEESLDFIGEDTSETLGAARLRKVQQKTHRFCFARHRLKMSISRVDQI